MKRSSLITALVYLGAFVVQPATALTLTEDFSTDPLARWNFGVGDNSSSQFVWDSTSPSAYTGDPVGQLDVHLDSSLPSARLQLALGATFTDTDSFALTTRFSMNNIVAPDNTAMQIDFGLVNSAFTGGDRTGSMSTSANTFQCLEFNYFPAVSPLWGSGRTLTPVAFGAQKGSSDAFGNFAANWAPASDMGSGALPTNVTLQATLTYSGTAKTLTLVMHQVNPDSSLTLLNTGTSGTLDLVAAGYNTNYPFQVDSMAIMAYQDGWLFGGPASLQADLTFEQMQFTSVIPEPSSALLSLLGAAIIGTWRARRRG
jgi:hypothetical protein